jgi:agmatine deiminase
MKKVIRRLPAEWEKHQATLLSFPHEGADWPGKFIAIKWAFIEIIKKVTVYEPVLLVVKSRQQQEVVKAMLLKSHANLSAVDYIIQPSNRCWMRDSGPIIVAKGDGQLEALHFRFNGWAKYSNHKLDKHIPDAVAHKLDIPITRVKYKTHHVVMEGGAIDVNGSGTLITTRECLLDPKKQVRNPGFSQLDYEIIFAEFFGIRNVIWLDKGIEGDDTHGHIDDICRFVNRNTVVACVEINKKDPNHRKLDENLSILKSSRLEDGGRLNIVEIPMPGRIDFEDMRLPASYVNFLVTNGAVFVPTFNDKNDYRAIGLLREVFPGKDIIGIHALDLVWGLGTLHCLSREIPAIN